jgi:hypothetical protein
VPIQRMMPLRPIQQHHCTLRWAFSAKRVSVVVTDGEPDGSLPLGQRPVGLRGVWVVAEAGRRLVSRAPM